MPLSPVRRLASLLSIGALAAAIAVAPALPSAAAAKGSDFDPGFLVSDADFFNGTALTAAGVDSLIKGTNKGCAAGKTCIVNYRESITAKAATTRCAAIAAATNRTAGQIIATVAKSCGISAKAILVILQKEQSLVTATAPSSRAFAYAMGAGCPDSTGCTTPYQGLYEQVYYGASLLKSYTLPSSSNYSRYAVGKTSAIKYHPTASCGTKQVFVKNMATHALYVYTPYTPNAKALSNLYGTGDSCSSYGNRNFWRMYTDWWGPTGSAGALAVDAMYTKFGGASGALGARVGTISTTTLAGAGLYQQYKNGLIAWNLKNGAHVITGALATSWAARIGDFGWPKQDTATSTAGGGGTYQNFDSALLTQAEGGKVFTVWAATRTQYLAAKGPDGAMGWPAGYQAKGADGRYTQLFTAGTSYREGSKTGFVATEFVANFSKRGGVTSALGWPKGFSTTSTLRGGGSWQSFEKGMLLDSSFGTKALFGTTLNKFTALGGVAKVGWPTTTRGYVADTKWLRQDFEKGSIFVKGSTSAYVATEFAATWASSGFTTGTLGAPTSNPTVSTANGGGVYQGFKKAALTKATGGKIYKLTGKVRTAWGASGLASGTLGWPTSAAAKDAKLKVTVQKFQKGVVIADTKKYGIVGAHEWALAKKMGVGPGKLGWPTSGVKTNAGNGGGEYQKFSAGAITVPKGKSAVFVSKTMWTAWSKAGGIKGSLGWPTAAATTKSGVTTQKFQGGTITWSKAKGAKVTLKSK